MILAIIWSVVFWGLYIVSRLASVGPITQSSAENNALFLMACIFWLISSVAIVWFECWRVGEEMRVTIEVEEIRAEAEIEAAWAGGGVEGEKKQAAGFRGTYDTSESEAFDEEEY